MESQDYIVSFRRGKSLENVSGNHKDIAGYVKSLGLEVVEVYPSEKSVRINATDEQLGPLWRPLGSLCHIVKPVTGHARVSGTS